MHADAVDIHVFSEVSRVLLTVRRHGRAKIRAETEAGLISAQRSRPNLLNNRTLGCISSFQSASVHSVNSINKVNNPVLD